jgi:ParB/RepB/Spo0J family partition protein
MKTTDAKEGIQQDTDATTPETIALGTIKVSELNPRHDAAVDIVSLVQDLQSTGLVQPIVLRQLPEGGYEVIVGSRRLQALKEVRSADGILHAGEYRIVNWDDNRCIRSAISENAERHDLAPADEGRFLNLLAKRQGTQDAPLSDEQLQGVTGIPRPRINDARALADKFDLLPKSWQSALSAPPNCRPSDSLISLTHFKHVRKRINGKIDPEVRKLMTKAADEGWTAAKFKAALKTEAKATDTADGNDQPQSGTDSPAPGAAGNTESAADYKRIQHDLLAAIKHAGQDAAIIDAIRALLVRIEDLLAAQK